MARAKSTARAEARRRYRAAQAELEQPEGDEEGTTGEDSAAAARTRSERPSEPVSAGRRPSILGGFHRPDFRADLRAVPGLMRSTPLLWIPFALIAVGGVLAASTGSSQGSIGLFVAQLTLYPTPLIVYFVAGFLAPRGSYIVGAAAGLLDGVVVSVVVMAQVGLFSPTDASSQKPELGILGSYVLLQVVMGGFGAAFASWYRTFLRNTSARSRQNAEAKKKAERREGRRPDPKRPASSTR